MNQANLSSYTPADLTAALRVLKSYTTASKQIGRRAVFEDPKHRDAPRLRVEYASDADVGFVRTFSEQILGQFFPEAQGQDCTYESNKNIVWGIRIFLADDMVDISFERFSHLIKNA